MARKRIFIRRMYGRKARKSKTICVPIGGIAIGLATAYQLRAGEAAEKILDGDIRGAFDELGKNSVADVLVASIPPLVYGWAKKATGTVTLFKLGKVRITI